MGRRLLRASLLLGLLLGCSDEGPQVPLLFVKPPTGSNGAGTITSAPGGISCTIANQTSVGACSANFETGVAVTLTASPAAGSTFSGWGGECEGSQLTCEVTLDASADVTAGFALANPRHLAVAVSGAGSGAVTSIPGGVNCVWDGAGVSGTCEADFADGAVVTLTAAPALGTGFTGWSEDCSTAGNESGCDLTMSDDHVATASFARVAFSGFMASTSNGTTGLIVVSIPVASAKVVPTLPPGVSLATAANGVFAVGTMTYLGSEPFTVAGVYDTTLKTLAVTSGDGFTMDATFNDVIFGGSFADETRNVFGISALTAAATAAPATFCGNYVSDAESPLADNGSWNIVISGDTLVTGVTASTGFEGAFTLEGSAQDQAVTLTFGDGTAEGSTTDATTYSGTFSRNDSQLFGTWTASSANCQ